MRIMYEYENRESTYQLGCDEEGRWFKRGINAKKEAGRWFLSSKPKIEERIKIERQTFLFRKIDLVE